MPAPPGAAAARRRRSGAAELPCAQVLFVALAYLALVCSGHAADKALGRDVQKNVVYNEETARTFAHYAQVSFCAQEAVQNWSCGYFCEQAPIIPGTARFLSGSDEITGVQGYVARLPDRASGGSSNLHLGRCVAAFRGTKDPDLDPSSWKNSFTDAMFLQTPWPPSNNSQWWCPVDWFCHEDATWCPDCWVHYGFSLAWTELLPGFLTAIKELECDSVVLTGHSLGAGVAEVASVYLRGYGILHVEPAWTYGKPRSGNEAFMRAALKLAEKQGVFPPVWRIVHYHDVVPRLFPVQAAASFGVDYSHGPLEVYYNPSSSSYEICPSDDTELENKSCMWATSALDCNINDHILYLNVSFEGTTMPAECLLNGAEQPSQMSWLQIGAGLGGALFGIGLLVLCLHRDAWTRAPRAGPDGPIEAGRREAPLLGAASRDGPRFKCCVRRPADSSANAP